MKTRILFSFLLFNFLSIAVAEVQPPAPESFYSALCEIIPEHDQQARYTAYCQVQESTTGLIVRYSHYETTAFPTPWFDNHIRLVQYSKEFVLEHFPFIRVAISGWGQTIIYPVDIDRQITFIENAKRRGGPFLFRVSWQALGNSKTDGLELSIIPYSLVWTSPHILVFTK